MLYSHPKIFILQEILTYPEVSKQEHDDLNEMCGPLEKFFENCKRFYVPVTWVYMCMKELCLVLLELCSKNRLLYR